MNLNMYLADLRVVEVADVMAVLAARIAMQAAAATERRATWAANGLGMFYFVFPVVKCSVLRWWWFGQYFFSCCW